MRKKEWMMKARQPTSVKERNRGCGIDIIGICGSPILRRNE